MADINLDKYVAMGADILAKEKAARDAERVEPGLPLGSAVTQGMGWLGEQFAAPTPEKIYEKMGTYTPGFPIQSPGEQEQRQRKNRDYLRQLNIDPDGSDMESVSVDAAAMNIVAKKFPETYREELQKILAARYNEKKGTQFKSDEFSIQRTRLPDGTEELTYYDPKTQSRLLLNPSGLQQEDVAGFFTENAPIAAGIVAGIPAAFVGPVTFVLTSSVAAAAAQFTKDDIGLGRAGFNLDLDTMTYKNKESGREGQEVALGELLLNSGLEAGLMALYNVGGMAAFKLAANLAGKTMGARTSYALSAVLDNPQNLINAVKSYKAQYGKTPDRSPFGELGTKDGPTVSQVLSLHASDVRASGNINLATRIELDAQQARALEHTGTEAAVQEAVVGGRAVSRIEEAAGISPLPKFEVVPGKTFEVVPGKTSETWHIAERNRQTGELIEFPDAYYTRALAETEARTQNAAVNSPTVPISEGVETIAGETIEAAARGSVDSEVNLAGTIIQNAEKTAQSKFQEIGFSADPAVAFNEAAPKFAELYSSAKTASNNLYQSIQNAFSWKHTGFDKGLNIPVTEGILSGGRSKIASAKGWNRFNTEPAIKEANKAVNKKSMLDNASKYLGTDSVSKLKSAVEAVSQKGPVTYEVLQNTIRNISLQLEEPALSRGAAKIYLTTLQNSLKAARDKRLAEIDNATGSQLLPAMQNADNAWNAFSNTYRTKFFELYRNLENRPGFAIDDAISNIFPKNQISLAESQAAVLAQDVVTSQAAKNVFKEMMRRNVVREQVETETLPLGVSKRVSIDPAADPSMTTLVDPLKMSSFWKKWTKTAEKLFTPDEIANLKSMSGASEALRISRQQQAAILEATEKFGATLTADQVTGVEGLSDVLTRPGVGGADMIRSVRNSIFKSSRESNFPEAKTEAHNLWSAVRHSAAKRLLFKEGESDLGVLYTIVDSDGLLATLTKHRRALEELLHTPNVVGMPGISGKDAFVNLQNLVKIFKQNLTRAGKNVPGIDPLRIVRNDGVPSIALRPVFGVLNRRAMTFTAAKKLIAHNMGKSLERSLLDPQATALWLKFSQSTARGARAAGMATALTGVNYFDNDDQIYERLEDIPSSDISDMSRVLYKAPLAKQKERALPGFEPRRKVPQPAPTFLEDFVQKNRGDIFTRAQKDFGKVLGAAGQGIKSGIGYLGQQLGFGDGADVLREQEMRKLVLGAPFTPFNSGGIVQAVPRRARQRVL
jgi:hypothetical protein